jgi:hypothetical protein
MFRAIVGLVFIVLIIPFAALVASVVMKLLGVNGLLGVVVGLPVFIGLLVLSVLGLAAINDRLNNSTHYHNTRARTHTNGMQ